MITPTELVAQEGISSPIIFNRNLTSLKGVLVRKMHFSAHLVSIPNFFPTEDSLKRFGVATATATALA